LVSESARLAGRYFLGGKGLLSPNGRRLVGLMWSST